MTYLKQKYVRPVVNRTEFIESFPNTYSKKSIQPKIIIKGLNLLDACLDGDGIVVPGKSTLIIINNEPTKLKLLLAILNSKLAFFYIREKYPASSYNKGTTFTKDMINNMPIPLITEKEKKTFIKLIDDILDFTTSTDYFGNREKQSKVEELQHQIDQFVYNLYGLTDEERQIIEASITSGKKK